MSIKHSILSVPFIAVALSLSAAAVAEGETSYWGPAVLAEGKRFEVCADAKHSRTRVDAQVRFIRVADGEGITEALRLDPGSGECVALQFEQIGSVPVFALLETDYRPGNARLIASAAIINGIYESPDRRMLSDDNGQRAVTTYGPLRLLPDKRLEVCAHNPRNFAGGDPSLPIPVSFRFYDTENATEPFSVQNGVIQPGEGSCVSVDENLVRDRSFYAEVRTEPAEPGYSNPAAMSGAFIINGVFEEPIPPSASRFLSD